MVWRALGRSDFASQVRAASRTLSRESEVTALRGLAALEAGEVERAAEAFRTALRFAPPGPVAEPLGFQGTRIARTCLGWLVTAGRE